MTAIALPTPGSENTEVAEGRISELPLRVAPAPTGSALSRLDGARWPRSRDLTFELPPPAARLDGLRQRITRLTRFTRLTVISAYRPVIPPQTTPERAARLTAAARS